MHRRYMATDHIFLDVRGNPQPKLTVLNASSRELALRVVRGLSSLSWVRVPNTFDVGCPSYTVVSQTKTITSPMR